VSLGAGCASGQEAYTLAIVLAEALGLEDYAQELVKIYATDVDEEALHQVPRHLRCQGGMGIPPVAGEVATLTVSTPSQRPTPLGDFGRHNLVQDAPISRMDLLVCRNSLMQC